MKKFRESTDFILDEEFLRWVKLGRKDAVLDKKWRNYFLENPAHREMAEEARALLLSVMREPQHNLHEQGQKELWHKIESTIADLEPGKKVKHRFLLTYSIAATLLLLVIAGILLISRPAAKTIERAVEAVVPKPDLTEYKNEESTPHSVLLADGSTVLLQPNSSLRFPAVFAGSKREVFLSGEAFFRITKNPDKPFLVHANELVTQVLGTSFNVRAYDRERNVSVIVKTGKVSVYPEGSLHKRKGTPTAMPGTFILPNQQVVFSRDEMRIVKSLVEEPSVLDSRISIQEFQFTDTPIHEVFAKLEATYGITIIYDEEVLKNCMLNASLGDLNFYDKLRVICKGINAQYETLDAHIIISGTGCK